MSSSDFILNYLPSFYQNFMTDENGGSLITPIFDNYLNAMEDAIFQGQQISQIMFIDQCDPILIELYSTIDVTVDNKFLDGYKIDDDILKLEGLFLDGNFTKSILGSYSIKHDISNHIRYIVFDIAPPLTQSTIFVQKVYRDKQILQNIWGNLVNYKKPIPDYNTLSDGFIIDYNSIKTELDNYKNQIIALIYGSINGPSIYTMYNGLGIFLGLKYAPFDGVVTDLTSGITIESLDRSKTYTVSITPNQNLNIGSKVKKYDLLEESYYKFHDILSNPAIFTQILLQGQAETLRDLLNINISDEEKYAHLTFDSTISFDDVSLVWDMGDGTGLVKDLTGTTMIQPYYPPSNTSLDKFDNWVSPLFNNQKLYEMFRNLFILEFKNASFRDNDIRYYLDKVKPIWSKYLIFNYGIG